jgi:L-alanine-DL-glutamate epimerase-like enolase superfamily enzyme
MKITAVDTEWVPVRRHGQPYRWRQGLPGAVPETERLLLRIRTDEGAEGVVSVSRRGEVVENIVNRVLRQELLGANPLQREWLWHRLWELDRIEEIPVYAFGLVDEALWDLAGKIYGVPTYELLGGFRTSIPAYASTATFGSIEEYLDVADQCLALGYPAIKLHAWGDARRDAKLAERLRAHVGDEVPLMYDGSAGFDLADAVYLGRALGNAGYLWYEEPIREFSITSYRWLAERLQVPLLVAETSDGAHMNTADFIASGCATFVRTSAKFKGGLTGAMRIAHLADSFRLRAEVHGGGPTSVHLCMAIPNTTYYESLVTSNPVIREPLVDATGLVHAPTTPGVGLPADLELS